ncbi:MAG: GtrA family protein [Saccharofermentans sp.]|nr:GtrA family protein [Saccharofermentans sp.]
MSIKQLFEKYKDTIPYLFFGVCTTLVNIASYWICAHTFALKVMPSTIIAWIIAVLFAYITNRKWVFHSAAKSVRDIVKELLSFFACRLATGGIDWLCMFIFVTRLGWNDILIKIVANVLVIILNYLASKFLIFYKK